MLHPRVNNEALCDCRPVFYAALAERLRGLPEEAAILEINRWCAEHVAYQPTDERTRSALAVLRAGFGRCGEESMFAVNVLRACGFAARQVYVPRWAHCDDNHAWVEVRCGGAWHFLGACEPEAVLDRGWFNSAAGRAVLVHSRCFGEPEPGADLIGREGDVVYCNETARYADVRRLTVRVTDGNGMSAAGADVDFCILNNCEWYPAATVQTDASGMAALTCGLGSLRLLARRDGLCCEAFVSPEETGPVVLTLGKRAPAPDRWEPIELTAPRGGAVRGAVPTEPQRDLQERWLRQAHEAWTQHREARLAEADAQGRGRGAYLSCAASFLALSAVLLYAQYGAFYTMRPGFLGFLFCGLLWGLSLIVPGMTSSSILMAVGLFTPMAEGFARLDMAVILPWLLGMVLIVLTLARVVNWYFRAHYPLFYHAVFGIVLASTVVIIPLHYDGARDALLCLLAAALGAFAAYLSAKLQPKEDA